MVKKLNPISKNLESILDKVPHATASATSNHEEEKKKIYKSDFQDKNIRLSVEIPSSIKRQIKQYITDHPGSTEKSIILKGLKTLGFNIEDKYLYDLRSNNK